MNNLLIYFAFPIAIIIFSIILQKLLRSPIAVASLIFATFIIVTFTAFDQNFLIATLAYTILSFITALLTQVFCNNNSNQNTKSTTNLCNTLIDSIENSNDNISVNNNEKETTNIPEDDNVINNNYYGCIYKRRYRKC